MMSLCDETRKVGETRRGKRMALVPDEEAMGRSRVLRSERSDVSRLNASEYCKRA